MEVGTALVVEDERSIGHLVATIAARAGYSVDRAADGAEAIRLMDQTSYSVIILDLMMPKVSGFEVMEHIRETECAQCVIILTAGSDRDIEKVDHSLIRKVIRKPFDVTELEEELIGMRKDQGAARPARRKIGTVKLVPPRRSRRPSPMAAGFSSEDTGDD